MIIALVGLLREAQICQGENVCAAIGEAALDRAIARGAQGIISIGVAGGLDGSLSAGDCVIATEIVHRSEVFATDEAWTRNLRSLLPDAMAERIAGVDKIVSSSAEKSRLFAATRAAAADMESHIAARAGAMHGLPVAVLRVVLDAAAASLPSAALTARRNDGSIDVAKVVMSVALYPRQIPALIRIGRDAEIAFGALLRCRNAIGPLLGFLNLGEHLLDMT
jgi:adenosylhomocysteine nucleosidase